MIESQSSIHQTREEAVEIAAAYLAQPGIQSISFGFALDHMAWRVDVGGSASSLVAGSRLAVEINHRYQYPEPVDA